MNRNHRNGTSEKVPPLAPTDGDDLLDESDEIPYSEWLARLPSIVRARLEQVAHRPPATEEHHEPDASATLGQLLALVSEVRDLLLSQGQIRDYYSTEQAAAILGRANWTVREWCRLGRINAEKRYSGRGRSRDWVISHAELLRIQKEGLLPISKHGS